MTSEQRKAAKKFVEYWSAQRGSEKGEDQTFWNSLLAEVLSVSDVKSRIHYQEPVHCKGTTKFLDAWIPETQVLIEHKSRGIDLDRPQEGHEGQTPFQQAWDYDNNRPRREKARWIVVTNFDEIRIHDMEADVPETTYETVLLKDLAKEIHRLQFLVKEVESIREKEARVSVEAGRVVGKLYKSFLEDLGERANDPKVLRDLNILCVRLVFCVYAEDAGVFGKDQFLDFLRPFKPGSFHLQLRELFKALAQKDEERGSLLAPEIKAFPYVGGGLFKDETDIPVFSEKTARILLDEASEHFDWSEISPTIFGAVFESTLNPETRRKGGMHYTSEENIHKVIDPLFLDDLKAELAAIESKPAGKVRDRDLVTFQEKLGSLCFLDPACGSGNFLTETYLSLRKLENEALATRFRGQGQFDLDDRKLIHVSINQFFGIEINDFAVTVAQTAMWIAECKMMEATNAILSKNFTPLPLTDSAKIVEGNALRMDWPKADYIMGNPPFIGARNKSTEQAADIENVFPDWKGNGNLDYVTCWYKKAHDVMKGTATRAAFVSTNSICQGDGVAILWKPLFADGMEFDFAWRTFVWDSEAMDKAHVHVVIIGFSCSNTEAQRHREKWLFDVERGRTIAQHINGYLMDGPDAWIESRREAFCDKPLVFGSMPNDGGFLSDWNDDAKNEVVSKYPQANELFRRLVGSQESIRNISRWCLWLKGVSPSVIRSVPPVLAAVEKVRGMRLASKREGTRKLAESPHLFGEIRQPESGHYLLIPSVSSEKRRYVPMSFLKADVVANNLVLIVPNATLYHFGVLTSSVHMAWMRVVAGRLEMRYRYSAAIVYNNFPWPKIEENGEDFKTGVADFLCGEPVARLTGHEFEGVRGSRALKDAIHESYARVNWMLRREDIGDIHLTRSGVNDSLHHGFGRAKLSAFAAIPEIIMSGHIVRHSLNWKNRGYNSFVLVAPIEINGESYCAFAIVNSIQGGGFRFYLHEVARIAELEERTEGFRSGSSDCSALSSTLGSNEDKIAGGMRTGFSDCSALSRTPGSIKSLAFSIFDVKGSPHASDISKKSELKSQIEKTAQSILDARALYPDSSLADLYDPLTMPLELRKAHATNDAAVMKAYGFPSNLTEPEIVSRLFEMYAKLTA